MLISILGFVNRKSRNFQWDISDNELIKAEFLENCTIIKNYVVN